MMDKGRVDAVQAAADSLDGQLEGLRVVVVEDDGPLRHVVQRALAAERCLVTAFEGPLEALEDLRQRAAGLLLADLGLPDMDGLALVQRARDYDPALPVLIMTGWETAQSAMAAADLGVDGYLSKPFTLKRLATAARRAVRRAQMEQRLRALLAEQAATAARLDALRVVGRTLPHELHQPLSCLMGYAALLGEEPLNLNDAREYSREIVQAAERLAEIVRKFESANVFAVKDYGHGNVLLDLERTGARQTSE